jgi:DNA-binding transcriptional ArsR family regulator
MNTRTAINPEILEAAASIIKCIGHPLRLRLLEAMEEGEMTVIGLQVVTGATQAMVSQQLGILRGRGIVSARRDGPYVFYHITEPKVFRILNCIRECGADGHVPGQQDRKDGA